MKCVTHHADATAICVYCGAALCPSCGMKSTSARFVCSQFCAEATAKAELAAVLTLEKTTKGYTVYAFSSFFLGGMFVVFAVFATVFKIWLLAVYLGVPGIGFIICGIVCRRAGKMNAIQQQNT